MPRNSVAPLRGRVLNGAARLEAMSAGLTQMDGRFGTKQWLGYIVFEFAWSKSAVLECPIEGNATYVLSGDWNRMHGVTKSQLRMQFSHHYTKVVHKGEWLGASGRR